VESGDLFAGFVAVVLGAFALFAFVMFWFTIPTNMAEERGRSAGFWTVIGFLTTPLVSIGLLLRPCYQSLERNQALGSINSI
jgi:hypothetical protein